MKTYLIKTSQTEKAILDDVEVEVTEEETNTKKTTICPRNMKARIEGIDNQIVQLQSEKAKLQEELLLIESEAGKYQLKEVAKI